MSKNGYVVETNLPGLECTGLVEPKINHEASTYIVENLNLVIGQARKMVGVDPEKVEDLVQDLIESILRSEARGEGYDVSHSSDNGVITVAEFVFGRLKLYSKNTKYQAGASEKHVHYRKDENGKANSANVDFEVIAASSSADTDFDALSGVQKSYATAKYFDCIDDIDNAISLRQDIELCIKFDSIVGISFLNMFKNIEMFANSAFEDSVFEKLRSAMGKYSELREALHSVISASATDRHAFDLVVATI